MEDLHNPFSNDDPITLSADLRQWYIAVALIGSNLAAILGVWYFYRLRMITEMVIFGGSAVVSIFYHTCQTTTACFHLGLQRWTFSDHITAGFVPAMLVIMTIRAHTLDSVVQQMRAQWATWNGAVTPSPPPPLGRPFYIHLGDDASGSVKPVAATGLSHSFPESFMNAVLLDARWTNGITYTYLIIVVFSTICHPYSMQNFIIILSFGACVILFKLVIIDRGNPEYLLKRISVPDLLVGLLLIGISLIYFVLDAYLYYALFHSLWHIFSNIGVYFYACGITKGLPGHHSPVSEFHEKVRRARRRQRTQRERGVW